MLKFKEVQTKNLNNGWTMGAGVIVGAGTAIGGALLIAT
ncbi:hypothetical protein M6K109_2629 [Staphylococcus aureus]|nr:hypothetical protein M6K109_2629 [Staphylococcus aureus]